MFLFRKMLYDDVVVSNVSSQSRQWRRSRRVPFGKVSNWFVDDEDAENFVSIAQITARIWSYLYLFFFVTVVVHLRATGGAPILKRDKFKVRFFSNRIESITLRITVLIWVELRLGFFFMLFKPSISAS